MGLHIHLPSKLDQDPALKRWILQDEWASYLSRWQYTIKESKMDIVEA